MYEEQISVLALDKSFYISLEKALVAAVHQSEKEPPKSRSSKRSSGIPQEQLDSLMENADLAYANGDWTECVKTYSAVVESGADVFVDGRLALSYACLNEWEPAYEHATKSFENNPAESAAYIAMAKCCNLICSLPSAGLRWLHLASKGINLPKRIYIDTKRELEEAAALNEQEERYAIPYLLQPNVYERIAQNPEFTSLIDMEELKHALSAVQEDIRSLPLVRGRSAGLSALLKILYTDPDVLLPQHLSPEQVASMMQKACPMHYIGPELIRKIASYLPLSSISALQRTCKLNRYWANQPEVWKDVYCRQWEPLQQSTFGVPLLPYMWKYNFKSRHALLAASKAIFDTILHQRADPADIEVMRKRALSDLARVYRLSSAPAAAGTMSNQFIDTIDLLASSTSPYNALMLFDSPAFLTVSVTSLTRAGINSSVLESQTALLALICAAMCGGPHLTKSLLLLGTKSICSNLMYGPLHLEACALYGVLRLGETNFAKPVSAVMPSSFWCANFTEERLSAVTEGLNGVWRHFMFYDNYDLQNVIEIGASMLNFDFASSSIAGSGSDTMGAFTVLPDSHFNLRSGEVTIIREYRGAVIEFVGVAHPFGFAGYFQMAPTEQSEDTPLLGYWVSHLQYKSLTDEEWRVFLADMKSKAAKRAMGKHPKPWEEEPGELAALSLELRAMTRETFTMSLPSTTYQEIFKAQAELPDITNEELQKFDAPPLLRGPGETDEKFTLRTNTHKIMMMMLFNQRLSFGLQKWEEVENDLRALETNDVASPAILHKWHDNLCLYTFDSYSISSGVDGLCQYFQLVLSMAQEMRIEKARNASISAATASSSSSSSSTSKGISSATTSGAQTKSGGKKLPPAAFGSSDDEFDRLPDNLPRDSDVDSVHTDEDIQADDVGVDVSQYFANQHRHGRASDAKKSTAFETSSAEESGEEEDEYDDYEDGEDDGAPNGRVRAKTTREASSISTTTLLVAAGVVAAVSAGMFAVSRYFYQSGRPKRD